MSEPVNPFGLDLTELLDWCAAEGVSFAGMFALRHGAQLGTRYRWDAARRGTEVTRAGAPDFFLSHDWLEHAIEERDAQRAALAPAAPVAEVVAVQPLVVAPAASAPRPAPPSAAPVRPQVKQLGLFGGGS